MQVKKPGTLIFETSKLAVSHMKNRTPPARLDPPLPPFNPDPAQLRLDLYGPHQTSECLTCKPSIWSYMIRPLTN